LHNIHKLENEKKALKKSYFEDIADLVVIEAPKERGA